MSCFDPYDSLVPIFLETEVPKRVIQIGSGVFKLLDGEPFLLTAAHVTDESRNGTLLFPTIHGLTPIEGYMAYVDLCPGERRADDTNDVAYFRLSPLCAKALSHHFTPLPQDRSRVIVTAHELNVCSASGYPASKSKRIGNSFSSEIFSFRGRVADKEIYDQLSLSPNHNIVLHFHKKRAVYPGTLDKYPTPGLKGISGGGIFAWPEGAEFSDDWRLPMLVGLVHTFKEKDGLIIGTTLTSVLAAIGLGRMKNFHA